MLGHQDSPGWELLAMVGRLAIVCAASPFQGLDSCGNEKAYALLVLDLFLKF